MLVAILKRGVYNMIKRFKSAFTLVELLVIIAVVTILFTSYISRVDFTTDKAKNAGVLTDFRSYEIALDSIARETQKDLVINNNDDFIALINKSLDKVLRFDTVEPYLSEQVNPYGYKYELKFEGNEAIIYSINGESMTVLKDFIVYAAEGSITEREYYGSKAAINIKDDSSNDYMEFRIGSFNSKLLTAQNNTKDEGWGDNTEEPKEEILKLNVESLELNAGETYKIESNYAESTTYTSNNTEIASVDYVSGIVTAHKAGTALITATSNSLTASCEITVVGSTLNIKDVKSGLFSTMVLLDNGDVYAAGTNKVTNTNGLLGNGDNDIATSFSKVLIDNVDKIFVGDYNNVFIKKDGTIWASGSNHYRQYGDNYTLEYAPIQLNISDVKEVAIGSFWIAYLKHDGTVWVSGNNSDGQLGTGNTNNVTTLTKTSMTNVKQIGAGTKHLVVLKNDGSVYATGCNTQGELGIGNAISKSSFTYSTTGISKIYVGNRQTFYIKNDGTVWANGYGMYGALGTGGNNFLTTPTKLGLSDIVDINTSTMNTLFLKSDGTLLGSGDNSVKQLGENPLNNSSPVLVKSDISKIAAGNCSTVVVDNSGKLYVSGHNTAGKLGVGNTIHVDGFTEVVLN